MKMKKYILPGLLAAAMIVPVSCSKDFIKEDLTTSRNTDYFTTNQGLDELCVGLYSYLRYYHCSEAGYSLLNYGTDEYSVGADNSNGMWNDYGASLTPTGGRVNTNTVNSGSWWDYMYTGINSANTLLARIEDGTYTGANVNTNAGVAYFIRALHYYNLVTQFGGVPLKLEPTTIDNMTFEFERNTPAEVTEQIIKDFSAAYEKLPAKASKTGEITKDAAAHFLAKTYLWRASELNDGWNGSTKSADLDNVIKYATEVVNNHPLAPNFKDLWNYTEPDGANEQLSEIVLAAQMTGPATTTWNVGGALYFYTTSQYRDLPGMFRDVPGGREYNRLRTTTYSIYQYDLLNDSRVWKTFRTKMKMNEPTNAAKAGYTAGKDLGLMYIYNKPGDNRFPLAQLNKSTEEAGTGNRAIELDNNSAVGTTFVYFPAGTTRDDCPMDKVANNQAFKYFSMNTKYVDGSRKSIGDSHCFRDGIIARSAEDYFFIAEAYLRKGDYQAATDWLNKIRARAAWKAGEDREEHVDGGASWDGTTGAKAPGISSYCNRSSYYESNNLPLGSLNKDASDIQITGTINNVADLPAEDQWIVNKLGVSGDKDVALCFLLNEKSREMSLELVRWVDLARTKTLLPRAKAFNAEAAENIQEYHYLRPIPQQFLNTLQKDGRALTADEKQAMQNPGY